MKIWSYGINSYYKTADITIDILPWYIHLLDSLFNIICGNLIPPIPFPSFIKVKRDDDIYTLREWYGDLRQWFHCIIHVPIFDYIYASKRFKHLIIEVDYDKCKATFKDVDKKF